MATADDSSTSESSEVERKQPPGYQIRAPKRNLTPPWHQSVVIDPDEKIVQRLKRGSLDTETYTPIKIRSRSNEFAVFVSLENGKKPTTEMMAQSGKLNVMLAKFKLDRLPLSIGSRISRSLGFDTTIYVKNFHIPV